MKPAPFAYAKARSLDHAIELLGSSEEPRLLAGGQSLMATLNMRLSAPRLLIDLNGVAGLGGIAREGWHGRDRRAHPPRRGRALGRHRPACAADRAGAAAYRPSRDPQPRHHRRLDRLRRSGGRAAGLPARAWRRSRDRRSEGQAHGQGRRLLQGSVRDRARPAGRADRDPRSGRDGAHPRPASLNSRAGTATTPWSGWRRARAADGKGLERRAARLFRRRRDAAARQESRGGARRRLARRCGQRARSDLDPPDDVQATGAVKKHLAGVLLRRVAKQLAEPRVMTGHRCDITLTVNGETVMRRVEARTEPGRFPARGPLPHRQPCRLRAWRVRRLHRAGRRRDRARLPDAGGAMRRRQRRDHRRNFRRRRDRRPAGGIRAAQRAAMRLLHARHAADRAGAAAATAACRAARRSANRFPAITAAAPAIRPSSMPSRRSRRRAEARP